MEDFPVKVQGYGQHFRYSSGGQKKDVCVTCPCACRVCCCGCLGSASQEGLRNALDVPGDL